MSRSSSVSRLSISENATKIFEGRVYVANSTTFQWKVEVITNETEFGNTSAYPCTIGAHQVLPLSCIYEFQEDTIGLISRINKRPIIVKATKKNDDLDGTISYELAVKNKSGLIITDECLIYSQKRYTPRIFKPFTFGDQGCWKSKFVKNMTYDPHKNISKGGTCPTCKAQNTQRSSTQEPWINDLSLTINLPICQETQKSEEGQVTTASNITNIFIQQQFNNCTTNISNIAIENLPEIRKILPLTTEQESFLSEAVQEQKATTLNGFNGQILTALPKIDTILKSVCLMWWTQANTEYTGTGFLAKIPGIGTAFLSVGHNFESILRADAPNDPNTYSLHNFTVHFGNVDGAWHSNGSPLPGTPSLTQGDPMNLGDLLEPFNICGSISYGGRRILFKNGKIVKYEERKGALEAVKDYCALLFEHADAIWKLNTHGLSYLECGHDDYLDSSGEELVAILGHPVCGDDGGKVPLRLSFGKETHPNKIALEVMLSRIKKSLTICTGSISGGEKTKSEDVLSKAVLKNYLFYDNDTLPGNSGSPVIGRGNKNANQAYNVKGIHVASFDLPNTNRAQTIKGIKDWIDVGKNYM